MTAFADYTDLRLAVSEQVGNHNISDVLDRFTKSAEAWFNRELRCREMLSNTTLTFSSGVAALPSDFIEVSKLSDSFGNGMPEANRSLTNPSTYAVDSSGFYIKDFGGSRNLEYYAKLPTLTASLTSSNWLLQKSPNLYLYAVSLEAAKWVKDVELVSGLVTLRDDEMNSLKWADARGRFGSSIVTTASYGP